MSLHWIDHLVHHYGLLMVFVVVALQALGLPLPGTTALVAAALYAATGHGLPIVGVIAAGATGAVAGTAVAYALGRWRGERLMLAVARRLRQSPEHVNALRHELSSHGAPWLFIARFVTGLRNVIGWIAGAAGVPVKRFLPVTAAAAVAWAAINALEYYWFGHAIAAADTWLQVVLVCLGLAWLVLSFGLLRRRALRRLQLERR